MLDEPSVHLVVILASTLPMPGDLARLLRESCASVATSHFIGSALLAHQRVATWVGGAMVVGPRRFSWPQDAD